MDEKGHSQWSEVKNKAWKQRKRNPNAFYYRFNEPGEENKVGPWSEEEKKLFFIRLEEMGGSASRNWGIFSKAIPGRVGYQCAAFYRKLVRDGEIKDDNYKFDENGRLIRSDSKNMVGKLSSTDNKYEESEFVHNYCEEDFIPSPECYRLSDQSITTSDETVTNSKRKRRDDIEFSKTYNKKPCFQSPVIRVIEGSNGVGSLYIGTSSLIDKDIIERYQIKSILNCFNEIPQYFNAFIQNMFINKPDLHEISSYKFISKSIAVIRVCILNGQNILIHCDDKRILSSSIVAAYLLEYENIPLYKTKEYFHSIDPNLKLHITYLHGLIEMEKDLLRKQICINIETNIQINEPICYTEMVYSTNNSNAYVVESFSIKKSDDNEKERMETIMPSELIKYTNNLNFCEEDPLL